MQRIFLTGGTGFVGRALQIALLARGDAVTLLSRRAHTDSAGPPGRLDWVQGDPTEPGPWMSKIAGTDAVIHLAGERAVGVRYTAARKEAILASRVRSTALVVEALANSAPRPTTFVCASAVGYYGSNPGSEAVDETSPAGSDFLAQVCESWEGEARKASTLKVRSVQARFGLILGADGGALAAMLPAFRAGVGGRLGNGQQMMSWVHLNDVVGMILHALGDPTCEGPVNITAPSPVTNRVFTQALARQLKRPAWFPVPGAVLKLLLKDGAKPILGGQAAIPAKLQRMGYAWEYPELPSALASLL